MDIDIEEVLTTYTKTEELPGVPGFELFSAIHKQWVKNGGLKKYKNIRSVTFLRSSILGVASLYPKLNGYMPMLKEDLVKFLKLFLSTWNSDDSPNLVVSKVERLADCLYDGGSFKTPSRVRHVVRSTTATPASIRFLLNEWFEREFGKIPDRLTVSYFFGDQKGELIL